MTDADRIARILQLAHEVYGSREAYGRLSVVRDSGGGVDVVTEAGGVLIAIGDHPHALEACEVALLLMLARSGLDRAYRLSAELAVLVGRAEQAGEGR